MLEHPQTLCLKVNGDTAMDIYQPYCYLIGWSNFNKFYYGVRYAKIATPEIYGKHISLHQNM